MSVIKNIGVVDPACRSIGGHNLTSLCRLKEAMPQQNIVFHVSSSATADVKRALGNVRLDFNADPYRPAAQRERRSKRKVLWYLYQFSRLLMGKPFDALNGEYHLKEMERLFKQYDEADHLVFPTTSVDLLTSILSVIERDKGDRVPSIHMRFLEYGAEHEKKLVHQAFERLRETLNSNKRVFLYCETDTLKSHLARRHGLTKISRCILQAPPADNMDIKDYTGCGNFIRIGLLGTPRTDKGFSRLPGIIAATMELTHELEIPLKFVVQTTSKSDEYNDQKQGLRKAGFSRTEIEAVPGPLSERKFAALLASCDMLLLPYTARNRERIIGSGLLLDAKINAIPVICPPHDTLTEFLSVQTGANAETDEEFAGAIVQIAGNLDRYKSSAQKDAAAFQNLWHSNALTARLRGEL
ncbi:MAG: hypothetical protein AAFP70_17810 [Calditrichota bacterium]